MGSRFRIIAVSFSSHSLTSCGRDDEEIEADKWKFRGRILMREALNLKEIVWVKMIQFIN